MNAQSEEVSMPCVSWPARDLFLRAELLAYLLYRDRRVSAVAITGSLARGEDHVHDIDLVVLMHGPEPWNAVYADPVGEPAETYSTPVSLGYLFADTAPDLALYLRAARGEVPLNLIVVSDKVLTDCAALAKLATDNTDADFHKTVFCEIPLTLLIRPAASREVCHLTKCGDTTRLVTLEDHGVWGTPLRHVCKNGCAPARPWSERQHAVRARRKSFCTQTAAPPSA